MDMLSELAPNYTPYRYGFNNPVFWQDATGLFETRADAEAYKKLNKLSGATIEFDSEADLWKIFHGDRTITQLGDVINTMYMMAGEMYLEQTYVGNGGGSDSSSGDTFLGFSPSEIGTLATAGSVFVNGLEGRAQDNANYKYKYGSKTHTAQQLTELNKARMNSIAKGAKLGGQTFGVAGSIITAYQGATDGNGFTTGDGVKVAIGIITTFTPYGWVYGALDLGVLIISDTSLTDRIGDYIDNY